MVRSDDQSTTVSSVGSEKIKNCEPVEVHLNIDRTKGKRFLHLLHSVSLPLQWTGFSAKWIFPPIFCTKTLFYLEKVSGVSRIAAAKTINASSFVLQ